ncbi:Sensors of blue-light using FAD [[Luteovulum] sphaeroides subsp. megalophilum]|uniref:light-/oxygen-sensing antirepressor AppA n=1 Tax=Cereibacter sphaeroides TaxID=1063 RepID=UPI000B730187|nr:light-/oxygen-sensing antirepressor AppA [Cereibacter sphaeroides]SNT09257.1 Sensors of blue-light using FAD [[Luteovulum] sphaeroides subsp. megalophilum]
MQHDLEADVTMTGSDLVSCCYRSLAAPDLTLRDLLDIVETSQAHNARAQLTGALFYSQGVFFQWLEGHPAAVAEVMSHIQRDRRHSNVEILAEEPITKRRFAGWHMQLSCSEADMRSLGLAESRQIVTVGRSLVADNTNIFSFDRIAAVRRFLSDVCAARTLAPDTPVEADTFALYALTEAQAGRSGRAKAVARLSDLLSTDPLGRLTEVEELLRAHAPTAADFARLFEACAERLTRALAEDRISRMQVTLAYSALQMALRRIHHLPDPQKSVGAVLVAGVPGHKPILEAALAAEMLRAVGWSTSVVHPESVAALAARLKTSRTSTLVVAPSLLEGTEQEADTLRFVSALRARTDLPGLSILIGGRLAQLPPSKLKDSGADAGFAHLALLPAALARVACPANADCCSMRACRMPASQCCDKRINPEFLLANVMPSVLTRISSRQDRRRSA